jgi:hypothetical protein
MRKILTIAAAAVVAFSVFYSVILNTAVLKAISLCLSQPAEESNCMESCCTGVGITSDCCCYFSETPNQTDTLVTYESFSKSIYNYVCGIHTYDKANLNALYYIVDCETKKNQYIALEIFRPPKSLGV